MVKLIPKARGRQCPRQNPIWIPQFDRHAKSSMDCPVRLGKFRGGKPRHDLGRQGSTLHYMWSSCGGASKIERDVGNSSLRPLCKWRFVWHTLVDQSSSWQAKARSGKILCAETTEKIQFPAKRSIHACKRGQQLVERAAQVVGCCRSL